ncbi:MAG: Nramp family divalent metal transporter [Planctomycetota bacterium]|nr:Nramp family divalent metal transporter [Planctomycetota bacterium]
MSIRRPRLLTMVGPGLLVAATGVGAGDLATAGFAGSKLGVIVLWAVVLGAAMKFVLNEGLARWQLATETTLLEGVTKRIGRWAMVIFLIYLIPFSFFVGGALISATGVATYSIIGWPGDPLVAKLVWGGVGSLIATVLVLKGGFQVFERVMAVGIVIMFVAVVWTAVMLGIDAQAMLQGLLPSHPGKGEPLDWTIGLIGGVGGTVTVLCYGYWINQAGRRGMNEMGTCRLDLAVAYIATAIFGVAMLVIASGVEIEGRGTELLVKLSSRLHDTLGPTGELIFLVGAWAAIASSLLGVWQSIPMLFTDAWRAAWNQQRLTPTHMPRTWTYRIFLLSLASMPMIQAGFGFAAVQRAYAMVGAFFLPLLAIVLLFLNRRRFIRQASNRPWTDVALLAVLVFFAWAAIEKTLG